MERVTQKSLPTGWKKYAVARHKLETVTRACTVWLATYVTSPTSTRNYSRGYLGSVRWAVLSRPSGEPTKSSVLQVTLVPYRDTERCLSVYGPSWKLLVYSWMGEAMTRSAAQAPDIDYDYWARRLDPLLRDSPGYREAVADLPTPHISWAACSPPEPCSAPTSTRTWWEHFDGKDYRLSFLVYIIGGAASGKTFITQMDGLLMAPMSGQRPRRPRVRAAV